MKLRQRKKTKAVNRGAFNKAKNDAHELREELKKKERALAEMRFMLDAILIRAAIKYGVEEKEDGKPIGWRLEMPVESVNEVLKNYRLVAEKRDENTMILGAFPIEVLKNEAQE